MNWFQALMPKEGGFFDLFERHAATLCAGARSLHSLLEGGPATPEHAAAVARHENDADDITREVMLLVRRTFITPFDRADIIDLTSQAVPLLRSMKSNAARLNAITEQVTKLEEQSDQLYDAGIAALYRDVGKSDPMAYIVGAEIYDHLEKVVDRFEDVANRISGVLIEHL